MVDPRGSKIPISDRDLRKASSEKMREREEQGNIWGRRPGRGYG